MLCMTNRLSTMSSSLRHTFSPWRNEFFPNCVLKIVVKSIRVVLSDLCPHASDNWSHRRHHCNFQGLCYGAKNWYQTLYILNSNPLSNIFLAKIIFSSVDFIFTGLIAFFALQKLLSMLLLGICPKDLISYYRDSCLVMVMVIAALLTIARKLKQSRCPSNDKWITFCSSLKKNAICMLYMCMGTNTCTCKSTYRREGHEGERSGFR